MSKQRLMKSVCEKSGVRRFGFHGLRHFTATWLADRGESIKTLQGLLRHKSMRTTEIYLHHVEESQRTTIKRLEGAFTVVGGVVGPTKKTPKRPQKTLPTTDKVQISVGI